MNDNHAELLYKACECCKINSVIPALVRVRSFVQFNLIYNFPLICNLINPIYTGLFANLKRLGGGNIPPPKLAISIQMTMKLGKNIL